MFSLPLLLSAFLPQVLGCADHANHHAPLHNKRQTFNASAALRIPTYWQYDESQDWGKINPNYSLCQTGTQQSPIALLFNQGLSQAHRPHFNGYTANSTGQFYNWGYGPSFTFYHDEGVYDTLPSMEMDNETLYMTGWHVHAPADHTVGGDRSKAELHYVHYDATGRERAVVAIRLDPGQDDSRFFAQFPSPMIHFNDTSSIENMAIDPMQAIREVANFSNFWTYQGSLTSPPCKEGLRWFVARNILFTSVRQMQDLLGASTFSARAEQEVWLHQVNV
ncbi:hypothetical protein LTR70_007827 [Exophiala xenobiotica]|uniref:Alpha-carbonic anhydrase domain-containing protein n=1 Tax=Lithohypha guttulata TaxID=1690604 RepID=A0ABR0K3I7_9EURO|nr:hypothetical protein LTR24_007438 [Lithohypha guttulata]KAK5313072.1 hypothetical protein LTR70_007827 [Exophiala xenobiotica]